jgi:hypothetical protein
MAYAQIMDLPVLYREFIETVALAASASEAGAEYAIENLHNNKKLLKSKLEPDREREGHHLCYVLPLLQPTV